MKIIDGVRWKSVPDFLGYWVSEHGDVWGRKNRLLSPTPDTKGYLQVCMKREDGKQCVKKIHRLVAELFVPNPEGKPQVNHVDANKRNNKASNLEWVTNQENHEHKMKNGLNVNHYGEKHGRSKLTNEEVLFIYASELKQSELAKKFGVHKSTINSIKTGRNYSKITGAI